MVLLDSEINLLLEVTYSSLLLICFIGIWMIGWCLMMNYDEPVCVCVCVCVGDIEFAFKANYGLVVFLFLLTLLPGHVDSTPVT
jgi:hypothetical protein